MKIQHTTKALLPVLLLVFFASCKKEAPSILDMFKVQLTFNQSQPYAVDENGDIEITSKDSVLIDYTIESPDKDMYMICLYRNGANSPAQKIPITDNGKRRTYSGTFKFLAKDLGAGLSSYRIWSLDKDGVYLGDGYKTITINVLSDLKYFANRKLFEADTTGKVHPCYLSILYLIEKHPAELEVVAILIIRERSPINDVNSLLDIFDKVIDTLLLPSRLE